MTRFLFDYDSTLAAVDAARVRAINERFGTNYTLDEITAWSWTAENYPEAHESFQWGPECFLNEQFQLNVEPVEGAIEGVHALFAMGHEGMVVSDRPESLFACTRQWLDEHDLDTVRLLFTRHKESKNVTNEGLTKQQAAVLHRLTHVIEDAPHHAVAFAEKPHISRVYLLDRPYNQGIEHEKITRCKNWYEVIAHIAEFR